jgi:hypothetical protein
MAQQVDTSTGWCCDGRTWIEHAQQDGKCCQPQPEDRGSAGRWPAEGTRAIG